MVIFPIHDATKKSEEAISAWKAVEEAQKQKSSTFWLVTQPSHAALAGDLAAALGDDLFGTIDAAVVRSIALHDAGWSMDDAEQIQRLREEPKHKPESFIEAPAERFLRAWSKSIDTAEKFAQVGGYLVSRHFERLSERVQGIDARKVQTFRAREKERQSRLKSAIGRDESTLERLVDALQFCDLLSLYLCCGSKKTVRFEQPKLILTRHGEEYRLDPNPFKEQRQFSFSALRHPVEPGSKQKSGATFYINL